MFYSMFEAMEVAVLYERIPGMLLGLLLVAPAVILLAIGFGYVPAIRSTSSVWVGVLLLAAAWAAQYLPATVAFLLFFGAGALIIIAGPLMLLVAVTAGRRLSA